MASDETQRGLAAILFTDIAGSTAVTARSEATGIALRDRHRELVRSQVERYHGRFIEAPGDESLSAFESALNAVNCALAIKEALEADADLRAHIGLHLGEIAFRGEEVFGDGVNVAARLCSDAPPNEIHISAALADALRGHEQLTKTPRGERTFKGVGQPVEVYAIDGAAGEPVAPAYVPQPQRRMTSPVAAAAIALLVLVIAGGWWLYGPTAGVRLPPADFTGRPAIAVLPFENPGGGSAQALFADGLAEDLITRLASWRSFPVIAKGSSFDPELPTDIQRIGRELGARYVVEGSVREADDRVRVVVQLVDATSGRQVWANQYDRDFSDVLALQGEISEAIVGAMNPALLDSEIERAMRQDPQSLDAWNAAMRGWWHFDQFTQAGMEEARKLFERAIELDPQWGQGYAGLALTHFWQGVSGWSESPEQSFEALLEAAQKAVALDELGAEAHHALGHAFASTGQTDRMIGAFEEGAALNPSHHMTNNCYGYHLAMLGRAEEAIDSLTRAMALSPRDPLAFAPQVGMASAYFAAADYERALGDLERARRIMEEAEQLAPITMENFSAFYGIATPDFQERMIAGLRLAGWEG
jgi:adenylate cyclase